MKSVLLFFIVIMGYSGGLFAQAPIPIYGITREAMPVNDWRHYKDPKLYFEPSLPASGIEFNTNAIPLKLGLMFISGAADGMTQVIAFHPDRFFAQHPNADRQFWDNSISWRNKYRNGDPQQGRAFVGSTTWLAWTTDAYHLFRTTSRLTAVAGLTIPLYKGSGKKLRHYAAEIGLSGLAWSAGFHTTYTLLY